MNRVKAIERNVMAIYEKPVNLVGYEISKGDYEWLIQRARRADQLEYRVGLEERRSSNLSKQNQRYKQVLGYTQSELEYAHVTGNMELRGELIKKSLKAIDEALEEESQ